MNHASRNELRRPGPRASVAEPAPILRLNDSRTDRTAEDRLRHGGASGLHPGLAAAGRAVAAALFPFAWIIVRVVVRVSFPRVLTLDRERLPRHGPALVVANHPAAWTDVAVLQAGLGRKLHFIAHQPLFRPWIRGLLLELFGALPVWRRSEDPASDALNEGTFARCRAAFRSGQVIAMFPEGRSGGDRDLLPLKTGAARLLLEHAGDAEWRPLLIPVAIYYQDRTAFRTAVAVAVGPPIPFEQYQRGDADARALTGEMARAITALLATAPARACASAGGPPLRGRAHAHGGGPGPPEHRPARRALETLAACGAAAGRVLHAVPLWAIERIARRLAEPPQQTSFARMVAGLVLIPLWYALLAGLALALGGATWLALPLSAPVLGMLLCRDHDRRAHPPSHGGHP